MSVGCDQFIRDLTHLGLLEQGRGDPYLKQAGCDAEQLAKLMVADGVLTSFQAETALQGRSSSLVIGAYVILDRIGAGGMGMVYKAVHRMMKRLVALKIMSQSSMAGSDTDAESLTQRFYREVEAAAKLTHPNIVTTYDAGQTGKTPYMVMEFVDGVDLRCHVKKQGPIPLREALGLILQAAEGLKYAHDQNIIHRDIKPANLLLSRDGEVKILDMGLARIIGDVEQSQPELTTTGSMMGTAAYMAPEQAENAKYADHRSDIYALGSTLYFLCTGKLPFEGDTAFAMLVAKRERPSPRLDSWMPDIPSGLQHVLEAMMARDPERRYQDVGDVIDNLQAILDGHTPELQSASVAVDEDAPTLLSDRGFPGADAQAERTVVRQEAASKQTPWRKVLIGVAVVSAAAMISYVLFGRNEVAQPPQGEAVSVAAEAPGTPGVEPAFTNSLGMQFVRIEPGEFMMGSPEGEPGKERVPFEGFERQHHVTLTKPILFGMHEVTRAQFRQFTEQSNYHTEAEAGSDCRAISFDSDSVAIVTVAGLNWKNSGFEQADDHPVVAVSWMDTQVFCKWLGEQESKTYRLPTDAEWEYVYRAGTQSAYPWGTVYTDVRDRGNLADISLRQRHSRSTVFMWDDGYAYTSPVGSYRPNSLGVYDLVGNVAEWCQDFAATFSGESAIDPLFRNQMPRPKFVGTVLRNHNVRGSDWRLGGSTVQYSLRAAYRNSTSMPCAMIGFRVVQEVED